MSLKRLQPQDSWSIECLDTVSKFEELRSPWEAFTQNHFMRGWDWSSAWINAFCCRSLQPRILVARDDAGVVGILPLASESSHLFGKRLILVGNGKACGDKLGILAAEEHQELLGEAFAHWLIRGEGALQWDQLDFDGVAGDDLGMNALYRSLRIRYAVEAEERECPNYWSIDLAGDWETVSKGVSKRTRRMLREIDREYVAKGRTEYVVASNFDEAKRMIQRVSDLHQGRWGARSIDGCFGTEGFERFVLDWIESRFKTNSAFVSIVKLDGHEVAGGIGFFQGTTLCMYLVGMDIEKQEVRPGWIYNMLTLRHAIDRGCTKLDFLRGDEQYKERLGAKPTQLHRRVVASPRLLPQLRYQTLQRGIQARNWIRKFFEPKQPVALPVE
jgi:CelD/BcsL family acetyltransferase involved in cellulose biosynthesis